MSNSSLTDKAQRFWDMHQGPNVLVIPNAWDVASARLFEQSGFSAIATSSAAIAWSRGYGDGEHIGRDVMLEEARRIIERVGVPVTVDLEAGYGRDPRAVAESIRQAIGIGAVGANIEDSTKRDPEDQGKTLFDPALQVERLHAAREMADSYKVPFVLNARVDILSRLGVNEDTVAEAIRRANSYAAAGARSVFVIGVFDSPTIGTLASEIGAPLNVLVGPGTPPISELQGLGVRRVTFGAGTARAAYSAAHRLVMKVKSEGVFDLSEITLSNQLLQELLT